VVLHPSHLSFGDRMILHALGVRWTHGVAGQSLGMQSEARECQPELRCQETLAHFCKRPK
jgi:hypothetical protein